MEKGREFKSRFKAKIKKIFESDEPATSDRIPANEPSVAFPFPQHTPSSNSPAKHSEPSAPVSPSAATPNQERIVTTAEEQVPSQTYPITARAPLKPDPDRSITGAPIVEQALSLSSSRPAQGQAPIEPSSSTAHIEESLSPKPASLVSFLVPDKTHASSSSNTLLWIKSGAWTQLRGFLDAVNLAAGISGLGPIKTIAQGLADCIGIYEHAAQGRKEYEELRVQLEATFKELKQYCSSSPVITTSIVSICGLIQKELDYVKTQQARPIVRQLEEAEVNENNVLECYRRIQDHLQRLSRNANISTWVIVDQLATDNRLRELAPSFWACYNSEKATELKRGPCTEGTRTNVLVHMCEWTTSRNSGGVYWMNGMAGTGKTTIAYSLCQQLDTEKDRLLCASFFCSRLLPECRSVGRIIPSIAYQIAQYSRPFRYALSKAAEENPDAHTRSPLLQFDSLIVRPLSDIKVRRSFPSNVVVVIDALDECEDAKSTQQILEVLLTKSKGLPIKFVVSSRPEAAIRHQMERNGTWADSRVVLHELDTGEVQADIKTYLKAELAPINPLESEIKQLAERAGVLFIYAATVIRYVGYDDFGRNPRARLNAVLSMSDQRGKAQTKDIDQLYGAVLKAAINDEQLEEAERDDMKLILNTVVCSKAPLTIDSLNALLKLGDVERVHASLRPLWSVLHVMSPKMTVTTLHASFPDYLTDPKRSGSSPWHCDAATQHHILAQQCFKCIRDTRPQFNICQLESSYLNDSEVKELDARVEQFISLELRYACQFWSFHLDASEPGMASALVTLLEQFLANNLLLWMEVMNLTMNIATSPDSLTTAKRWATQHGATRELIDLMQDAWRCAFAVVSSPVSQSTPHIYVSMLPFLPSHSPIRKHYTRRMQGMIGVDGAALDRRKALLARWSFSRAEFAACSRDGTRIAVAPHDSQGRLSLIDGSSGRLVREYSHEGVGQIKCVTFSPAGTCVAFEASKTIYVWDLTSGRLVLGPLNDHEDTIRSILFSHDGAFIISGSRDNTIRVWDAYSGKSLFAPLLGHTDDVLSLAISSDDTRIISGSQDNTIRVWDMQSGRLVLDPITGHTDPVVAVALSRNDTLIVSGSEDSTVRVWDRQTGQGLLEPMSHETPVCSVAISPDGVYISASLKHGAVQTWDGTTGKTISVILNEQFYEVKMLAYSSDGTRIISYTAYDGTLCLFDARSASVSTPALPGHSERVQSIDISPDGKYIASGSEDMTLCVWDPINGQLVLGPLAGHTDWVDLVRYSADGNRILSCSWDRTLLQWDAQTGGSLQVNIPIVDTSTPLSQYESPRFVLAAYSPDDSYIATISNGASVCVWDSRTGGMILGLIAGEKQGKSIEFSLDGMRLITGWEDGAIRIWDVQSGELVSCVRPQDASLACAWAFAFSSDRLYHVVAERFFYGSAIHRRITQTGEQVPGTFEGHTDFINCVQFSHDDAHIVSGSRDKNIYVWDVETGTSILGPLKGHNDWVQTVIYSPDNTYVASLSTDLTIRIWDANMHQDSSSLAEWTLNEDGWVIDSQSRMLIWVPPDLRQLLMWPRNTMLLSRDGYVRLSFNGALIGEVWGDCWLDS